jgi:hypothetical protein
MHDICSNNMNLWNNKFHIDLEHFKLNPRLQFKCPCNVCTKALTQIMSGKNNFDLLYTQFTLWS